MGRFRTSGTMALAISLLIAAVAADQMQPSDMSREMWMRSVEKFGGGPMTSKIRGGPITARTAVPAWESKTAPAFSVKQAEEIDFLQSGVAATCLEDTQMIQRAPGVFFLDRDTFPMCFTFVGEDDDGVIAKMCLKDLDPNSDPPVEPINSALLFEVEKMGGKTVRLHKIKIGTDHFCDSLVRNPNAPNARFRRNRTIKRMSRKQKFTLRIPLRVIKTLTSDCCRGPNCFVAEISYRKKIPVETRSELKKAYAEDEVFCDNNPTDPDDKVPFCFYRLRCAGPDTVWNDCDYDPPTSIIMEAHYNQPSVANPSFVEARVDIYALQQGANLYILNERGALVHGYTFRGETLTAGSPPITIEEKQLANSICFKGIVFTWEGGEEIMLPDYTVMIAPQALSDLLVFKLGGTPPDFDEYFGNTFSNAPPFWFEFGGGFNVMVAFNAVDPEVADQSLQLDETQLVEIEPFSPYFYGYPAMTKTPGVFPNEPSVGFGFPFPTEAPTEAP